VGLLKTMIVELLATLHQEQRDKKALQHRLDLLLRRLYGPGSERFAPTQLLLFADLLSGQDPPPTPTDRAATDTEKKKKPSCRPHGRRHLPDNLHGGRVAQLHFHV
jgi:hypothetical protein